MQSDKQPPHPFEKVFAQIEELLKKLEQSEDKRSEVPVPKWVFDEFVNLKEKLERLQEMANRISPPTEEWTDEELRKVLQSIPAEQWCQELEVIEQSIGLKSKTAEVAKLFSESPPEDTKKSNQSAETTRKRKIGRIAARKNWRAM